MLGPLPGQMYYYLQVCHGGVVVVLVVLAVVCLSTVPWCSWLIGWVAGWWVEEGGTAALVGQGAAALGTFQVLSHCIQRSGR